MEHRMKRASREQGTTNALRSTAWSGVLWVVLLGCAPQGADAGASAAAAPASSGAAPGESKASAQGPRAVARSRLAALGPDERRVAVIVLPGDALVEVDGQPVRRRDGVVELVGKVGEARRLRAFKGAKSTEEKLVTIQEGGASLALVDLDEPAPKVARGAGPVKRKPVTFDFDE